MIFKISARTNLLIKIGVFLKLIFLSIYGAGVIGNIQALEFNYYIVISTQILSTIFLLYIISVLSYIGEQKFIRACGFIYMVVEFIFSVYILTVFNMKHPQIAILTIGLALLVFIILASLSFWITSLFIRSQIIFKPLVIYTTALATYIVLGFPVLDTLVFFEGKNIDGVSIKTIAHGILIFDVLLSGVITLSIFWLTNRLNGFLRDGLADEI